MRSAHTRPDRRHTAKGAALVTLALLAFVALAALVAACGGVDGTYSLAEGDDAMKDFTLKLDGGDFTLAGPNPLGGEDAKDVEIKGTYTVDGDKISLQMSGGGESEVGTIDGGKLVFDDVTWEK